MTDQKTLKYGDFIVLKGKLDRIDELKEKGEKAKKNNSGYLSALGHTDNRLFF